MEQRLPATVVMRSKHEHGQHYAADTTRSTPTHNIQHMQASGNGPTQQYDAEKEVVCAEHVNTHSYNVSNTLVMSSCLTCKLAKSTVILCWMLTMQ